ncbi:MAG: aminotransferase class V-fold PLP-dependent enzyme [Planctomycetes bacterium]|nr:aminotransferase class V-fold PLP-dependent enzyme [Planctomycetota bacterium]
MNGGAGKPDAVFCDWNAGAPASDEVLATFVDIERRCPGNPASPHTTGRRARTVLEDSRQRIADAFGVPAADVVFTSGGTEAANLAVLGLGDADLPVYASATEHPAVHEPSLLRGVRPFAVDPTGVAQVVDPGAPIGLVCLVHAQSELGTLQPVDAALRLAVARGIPLFVDAAQTLGRVPVQPVVAGGAVVALSPHKAGGLRGHGVLLGHDLHRRLRPLLRGGAQELGLRPGTQSPALAAANAEAILRALHETTERAATMAAMRATFLDGLQASGVACRVLTPLDNSIPNTVMVHFPRVDGRNLVPALDLAGVHASHGSACSSGAVQPPRILRAIGLADDDARACVRFSFGWHGAVETLCEAGARVGAVVAARQKKN